MVELPDLKRGDTFSLGCLKKDSAGSPENLSNFTIACQIRNGSDTLIATPVISESNQSTSPGEFSITVAADTTKAWELSRYLLDIQFSVGSEVISSETARFKVVKDITHD